MRIGGARGWGAVAPATRTMTAQAVGPKSGDLFGLGKDFPRTAMAPEILHKRNGIRG